jgi:ATP-binding cassette subfamily B (MDR/TAP) protein 1
LPTREQRRYEGDRTALWFFIIAVGATCTLAIQVCLGSSAAAILASRLRSKGFRAVLRQDGEPFSTAPLIFRTELIGC